MAILIFIVILAILVLVHEFGHFIAAKKNGVRVEEFGFGFPPRLFGVKIGETLYSINLIPIGGFVKVYGEEYAELGKKIDVELKERAFAYKKPWQKAIIIAAGVLGNFLLGWVIISYLFTQGVPVPVSKVLVENVQAKSPAESAGLKKKDLIYAIRARGKEYSVTSPNDLVGIANKYLGKKIVLLAERNGKKLSFEIVPRVKTPKGEGKLG
ncbi:site-2 protease family protein, partial [Candidatus Roizmanbacteria bacterium]|nr:site-2 protease family protein [Candidatus Roizmanbacteria bacterium]